MRSRSERGVTVTLLFDNGPCLMIGRRPENRPEKSHLVGRDTTQGYHPPVMSLAETDSYCR